MLKNKEGKIPFCSYCGSRLLPTVTHITYDNATGKKQYTRCYVCPNKGFFDWKHDTATKYFWNKNIEIDMNYGY